MERRKRRRCRSQLTTIKKISGGNARHLFINNNYFSNFINNFNYLNSIKCNYLTFDFQFKFSALIYFLIFFIFSTQLFNNNNFGVKAISEDTLNETILKQDSILINLLNLSYTEHDLNTIVTLENAFANTTDESLLEINSTTTNKYNLFEYDKFVSKKTTKLTETPQTLPKSLNFFSKTKINDNLIQPLAIKIDDLITITKNLTTQTTKNVTTQTTNELLNNTNLYFKNVSESITQNQSVINNDLATLSSLSLLETTITLETTTVFSTTKALNLTKKVTDFLINAKPILITKKTSNLTKKITDFLTNTKPISTTTKKIITTKKIAATEKTTTKTQKNNLFIAKSNNSNKILKTKNATLISKQIEGVKIVSANILTNKTLLQFNQTNEDTLKDNKLIDIFSMEPISGNRVAAAVRIDNSANSKKLINSNKIIKKNVTSLPLLYNNKVTNKDTNINNEISNENNLQNINNNINPQKNESESLSFLSMSDENISLENKIYESDDKLKKLEINETTVMQLLELPFEINNCKYSFN